MTLLLALFMLFACFYGFYLSSSKQLAKTLSSNKAFLVKYPLLLRLFCSLLFISATYFIIRSYHLSIGFISVWIFASPILFFMILTINDLKPNGKYQRRS